MCSKNPHTVHKVLWDIPEIRVLCAMSEHKFIGPALYESTANADCYLQLILSPLFRELTREDKMYGHFLLVVN
jgi:hypothetical protein